VQQRAVEPTESVVIFQVLPDGWAETHPDPLFETLVLELGDRAPSYLGYDFQLLDWYLR
jgi:hypothetical protein